MKKETILYEKLEDDKVQCGVCQRKCVIPESSSGWCKTRVNEAGRLYSLIYGEVSSLSINPIEKKPVFHFYSGSRWLSIGSVGCNFRCPGCQNWDIAHWKEGEMFTEYISPGELVSQAKASGCRRIDTGTNFSSTLFGGLPSRFPRLTLSAASIALRARSTSRAVTRLARSKGNRFAELINVSLLPTCWSRADKPEDFAVFSFRKDNNKYPFARVAD